ncbi:MAG: hypothetical protein ACRDFB_06615, partial [Rhabdochlamydiaceae bacterium]
MAIQPLNPMQLPNFLCFNIDPVKGPNVQTWIMKPYNEWVSDCAQVEETTKIMVTNTAGGAGIGYIVSKIANFLISHFTDIPPISPEAMVTVGTSLGATGGFLRGIYLTRIFYLDRPVVINLTQESSEKAKNIINAFVALTCESSHNQEAEIMCPISGLPMIYPVDINCGSPVPHTFEYFSILTWLDKSPSKMCPLCNHPATIGNLTYDRNKERDIRRAVADIFKTMEAILKQLPKRHFGLDNLPNFSSSENINLLAK